MELVWTLQGPAATVSIYMPFFLHILEISFKKNTNKNLLSAFDKTTNVIFEN